jgi:predicted NAD/FAD-binding protein
MAGMGNDRKRILVVGGGVIGLTCAAMLGERHYVSVKAKQFSTATESVKATSIGMFISYRRLS